MKTWGFQGKKKRKVHPNFATKIAMEFHCHAFCADKERHCLFRFCSLKLEHDSDGSSSELRFRRFRFPLSSKVHCSTYLPLDPLRNWKTDQARDLPDHLQRPKLRKSRKVARESSETSLGPPASQPPKCSPKVRKVKNLDRRKRAFCNRKRAFQNTRVQNAALRDSKKKTLV